MPFFVRFFIVCLHAFVWSCSHGSAKHRDSTSPPNNGSDNNEHVCEHRIATNDAFEPVSAYREQYDGVLTHAEARNDSSCGADAVAQAFHILVPRTERLRITVASESNVAFYVQESCGAADVNALCDQASVEWIEDVTEGQEFDIILETSSMFADSHYRITLEHQTIAQENEACGLESIVCANGLYCSDNLMHPVCVTNHAPNVHSILSYKTGKSGTDLYVQAVVSDAEGNLSHIHLVPHEANTILPEQRYILTSIEAQEENTYQVEFVARRYFEMYLNVESFDVSFEDSAEAQTELQNVTIQEPNIAELNDACDSDELLSVCDTALWCNSVNNLCLQGHAPEITHVLFLTRNNSLPERLFIRILDQEADTERLTLIFEDTDTEQTLQRHVRVEHQAKNEELRILVNASSIPENYHHVSVIAQDHSQLESSTVTGELVDEMPSVGRGEACDTLRQFNQCSNQLSCFGETPVCGDGTAPVLLNAAYLNKDSGTVLLIRGQDAEEDVTDVLVTLLNDDLEPVLTLHTNGDGTGDSSETSFSLKNIHYSDHSFFASIDLSAISSDVTHVSIQLLDATGASSDVEDLSLEYIAIRSASESCSIYGFDACEAGTACDLNSETCVDLETLRNAFCDNAVTYENEPLTLQTGIFSLWNPPEECTSDDARKTPEAVFHFHLDNIAERVVISTNNLGTSFDTILYVLNDCSTDLNVLACSDDLNASLHEYTSQIEMLDVEAGDYWVVIDSYGVMQGNVQVSLQVE